MKRVVIVIVLVLVPASTAFANNTGFYTGARLQAKERGGTEYERRVYIAGLFGPPQEA